MPKPSLVLAVLALSAACASGAAAQALGKVTKVLRPQVQTFDDKGTMVGMLPAKDIKTPTPIVAMGAGNRLAIKVKDKVLYVRGLDVQTEGLTAKCAPVQTAAREKGSAYAASNMGLGGAAVCK